MSQTGLIGSSLTRKYWMGITGLFLCLFLVGHLLGNFQLLIGGDAGQLGFNEYAKFMTTNIAVKALSYATYFSILFHAIEGIIITKKNQAARPIKYVYEKPEENSTWASRNMAVLGSILFIFIVMHMYAFWAKMHFTELGFDSNDNKDLHSITIEAFGTLWYVALYVVAMIAMGFHLNHGFASAFQSWGLNHKKYTPLIKVAGTGFSILVPLGFAIIPVLIFLGIFF